MFATNNKIEKDTKIKIEIINPNKKSNRHKDANKNGLNDISDDELDDMDISWIERYEKEILVDKNYQRESMSDITVNYVYITPTLFIKKILSEKIPTELKNNQPIISKETILKLIEEKNKEENNEYRYADILLYNIDIEPNRIPQFATSDNLKVLNKSFLKQQMFGMDIIIPNSIFIFHDINSIFIFFTPIEYYT